MGIYVFSRDVLFDVLESHPEAVDFGKQIIPDALATHRVRAYRYDGYWADVGTIGSFFQANLELTQRDAAFSFHDPRRPIYTHPRFLAGSMLDGCHIDRAVVAEGSVLEHCHIESTVVGIRSQIREGARISNSVLLGADYYVNDGSGSPVPLGIGRNVLLDRVIVDKNAHIGDNVTLTNAAGVEEADGEGYYIREGIIIVPKGATVPAGTVV
jgi:glucose-1-phosphate adenylyltransferase